MKSQSNTNRGSALTAGKGKWQEPQANKGQKDSDKAKKKDSKPWKCRTCETNKHSWHDCPENPDSKNYRGEAEAKDNRDKKEGGGAKLATLENITALPVSPIHS